MSGGRLTALAHTVVARTLRPGGLAVDATMGNGHDTCFLARAVSPGGRVIAFDVQDAALRATRRRLAAEGLDGAVDLHLAGHEHLAARMPPGWAGRVDAVMFNLGYLPGGDKQRTTQAASTVAALDQALRVLRPGGVLSLLVYRGHPGAAAEVAAVDAWLASAGADHGVAHHASPGPRLAVLHKRGTG